MQSFSSYKSYFQITMTQDGGKNYMKRQDKILTDDKFTFFYVNCKQTKLLIEVWLWINIHSLKKNKRTITSLIMIDTSVQITAMVTFFPKRLRSCWRLFLLRKPQQQNFIGLIQFLTDIIRLISPQTTTCRSAWDIDMSFVLMFWYFILTTHHGFELLGQKRCKKVKTDSLYHTNWLH